MKRLLFIVLIFCSATPLFAQYVYTINADSVKITNHCDTAELIIENHTQTVPGFLFNKGRGRTEFRRGMITIDDSLYLIGADTLNLNKGLNSLAANNGLLRTGNTFQFANDDSDPYGPATQIRNSYFYQNGSVFNWMTGGTNMFTFSKYQYSTTETNALKAYYLARFYSPQGGILLEGNVNPNFNGPLSWINFKNDDPSAVTRSYFGDQVVGTIQAVAVKGADTKVYHPFFFTNANDTVNNNYGTVLRLFPTYMLNVNSFKVPTAATLRLVIEDVNPTCANCITLPANDNPYSRLVVDAHNYPLVVSNLPSNSSGHMLIIDDNGKVWKGDTVNTSGAMSGTINSSLAVNGTITAQKLKLSQPDWPDYVFAPEYHLPRLAELEQYIKQHNHLPGIPAATEVQKNGIDVGDNQAALLKKIEELTLYLVAQEKKSEAQDAALEKQHKEMEALKQQMAELRKLIGK